MGPSKEEIKKLIDSTASALQSGAELARSDKDIENAFRQELSLFLMYLSASDGEIKLSEATAISDLCGINLTPQQLATIIRENDIYSTEFENKAPICLRIAVVIDNYLYENHLFALLGADDVDLAMALITAYKAAAVYLIKADNDIDNNELSDMQIYVNMLEDYYNENSSRCKVSVSGFTKNMSGVSVPPKKQ